MNENTFYAVSSKLFSVILAITNIVQITVTSFCQPLGNWKTTKLPNCQNTQKLGGVAQVDLVVLMLKYLGHMMWHRSGHEVKQS